MTKEEAQVVIQAKLADLTRQFEEVRALADEHKVEFSFMGSSMHYDYPYNRYHPEPRPMARHGIFIADGEWQSSTWDCSEERWTWMHENWPEPDDDIT